jgi:hypothetical protein
VTSAAAVDRRRKKPVTAAGEGPSREAASAIKKRKLGTAAEGLGVSDRFAVELMGTCAAVGGRMSSLELRESSARMLEVTEGQWPRNVPIPRAAGEDIFTSRLAREMKIFPYGRNIAAVVSAVMDKDRQDATRKRWAFTRVGDPSREVKRARGGAKSTTPGSSKPPSAAKPAVPGPSKSSAGARAVAFDTGKPPSAEPTKERRPPSPVRTNEAAAGGANFDMDICVDDYRVGGVMMFDAHTGRALGRVELAPPSDAGEGPLVTPAPTGAGEDPMPSTAPMGDTSMVVGEPAIEDPAASVGPSQVAK